MTTRTARNVLIGLGVVAAASGLAAVLAVALSPGSPSKPGQPGQPAMDQYGAEVACETFVKQQTRQDATFGDEQVLGSSPSFIIQGTVTAGNLHATWTCTVAPNGQQWDLVSLDGLG